MDWKSALIAAGTALTLAGGASGQPSGGPDLDGDWSGQVDTGALKLRIVLHLHSQDGRVVATVDSPDQSAMGLPATVSLQGGHVRIALGPGNAFDGDISRDGSSLKGQWAGAPAAFERLASGQTVAAPHRPQTPVKPYPYREELIRYPGGAPGVSLAGTLTLPKGPGPFPAVVLIAGSGPHDRDAQVFGHRPFMVLADDLTRHGLAVLRYDKRGIAQSTGDYATATSADFAADAEAGVAYLKGRPEIDSRRIGLIGHSEGGLIAPMVAERDAAVAFLVLMGGQGAPGDQVIMAQSKAIMAASGAPPAAVQAGQLSERRYLDATMRAKDGASAEAALRAMFKAAGMPQASIDAQAKAMSSPWYRFFLAYDPAPALRRLRIPVLALIGSKDLQVTPEQNLPALRAAFANDPRAEVVELQGLNHMFQDAGTGAPSEYGQIEETMSPAAMDRISQWILTKALPSR